MDYKKKYIEYKLKYLELKNQIGGVNPPPTTSTSASAAVGPTLPPELMSLVLEEGQISFERLIRTKITSGNPIFNAAIDKYISDLMDDGSISMYNLLIIISLDPTNIPVVTKAVALFKSKSDAGEQLEISISALYELQQSATPVLRNLLTPYINASYDAKSGDMGAMYNASLSPAVKLKHLRVLFLCDVLFQLQQPQRRYKLYVTFGQQPNQTVLIYSEGAYGRINKNRQGGPPDEFNGQIHNYKFNKIDLFSLVVRDIQGSAQRLASIKVQYISFFNPTPRVLFDFNFI